MTINVQYSPCCRNAPIRIVPANPATPIMRSSTDSPVAPACVTASRNGRKYVNSVNWPMKKTLTAVMPSATGALVSSANAPDTEIAWPACPSPIRRSCAIGVSRLTGMNSDATRCGIGHSGMADWPSRPSRGWVGLPGSCTIRGIRNRETGPWESTSI
ncbi:hypothetical protein BamMEX5DRAFT_5745 [Burkholderia ambifaria MEX-5]|uniref:Uncharacterized protein n=1 Tax=Burkholderia ambifaria MEX-5 TaxID=396597 RepID=B1TD79_9BURK|nr:hypothetical protein BamMEX5DRAFT_5745 [Burkholderia ambifaria MEX-5]